MKKNFKISMFVICTYFLFSGIALPQENWPTKQVTMIHPYAAGGTTDIAVRLLGEALTKFFHQPFITVPKPGGNQIPGASFVARSEPDGYTIGHFDLGFLTKTPYIQKVPYQQEDIIPVLAWTVSPTLLVCRSDAPYKNLKEFVEYARNHSLSIGHNGATTSQRIIPMLFSKQVGINLVEVPFKGDGDKVPALIGGHIQLASMATGSALPLIEAGQIRALVTYTKERLPFNPEIPTFTDAGFEIPGNMDVIIMAMLPKGTPPAIVKKLHDGIRQCTNDPALQSEFTKAKLPLVYICESACNNDPPLGIIGI